MISNGLETECYPMVGVGDLLAGSLPHHAVFISRLCPHHPQGAGPSLTAVWQLGCEIMKRVGDLHSL